MDVLTRTSACLSVFLYVCEPHCLTTSVLFFPSPGYLTVTIETLHPVVIGDAVTIKCFFRTDGNLREIVWFRMGSQVTAAPPRRVGLLHSSTHIHSTLQDQPDAPLLG